MKLKTGTKAALGVVALVVVAVLVALPKVVANPPKDDVGATLHRFENVRAQRYTEMFLIGGNGITNNLRAGVYNTIDRNDPAHTGDTCPHELLEKVDTSALKKQYKVLGVFKNGPRLWTMDWIEVYLGAERDFNGLQARWVNWLQMPKGVDPRTQGSTNYQKITVERNTHFGFNNGRPVFILDDPEGNAWVMKSAGLIVDPNQTYESLMDLGNRLKPAPGWKFRVQMLEQDLVLSPDNGIAHITQDELGNTYDLTGGPYSNFKP